MPIPQNMASNKRRKLNGLSDEKSDLSAFAARKRLHGIQNTEDNSQDQVSDSEGWGATNERGPLFNGRLLQGLGDISRKSQEGFGQDFNSSIKDDSTSVSPSREPDNLVEITKTKQPLLKSLSLHHHALAPLTTVNLDKSNQKRLEGGSTIIRIAPGEKLVLLGEYGLSVIRGKITVLGAILPTSERVYDVCATSSHSLPVIRCVAPDGETAEVCLHQSNRGLRSLKSLSPLYAGLWSQSFGNPNISETLEENESWNWSGSSFQILLGRNEESRKVCQPVVAPPEWNEVLSISASEELKNGRKPVTMICGPKSSGKSTFARLLINRLLTTRLPTMDSPDYKASQKNDTCVAFLDLDPGQPEFSPPGQLSLVLLSEPNFGPPYSHPDTSDRGRKLLRAHSIAALSPSSDPALYMACMVDLLSCYSKSYFLTPYPLVINTPGWILGTGLELLLNLVNEARPSRIIYMSQDGPHEVVESLRSAAKAITVLTLPSQLTEFVSRPGTQLRTMQYMSYFHRIARSATDQLWNPNTITSMAPWEVKYRGDAKGILGVWFVGEQPLHDLVRDALDGSVVALVVIDDMAAIPGWKKYGQQASHTNRQSEDSSKSQEDNEVNKTQSEGFDEGYKVHGMPPIFETAERIPYLNLPRNESLDPQYSHTIGLALVRGIDLKRHRIQLLSPISESIFKDTRAAGKAIVLACGKLDIPGWAYVEELHREHAAAKETNEEGSSYTSEGESNSGSEDGENDQLGGSMRGQDGFDRAPWIERLQGDQGRGVGARVWRVRRDLGKVSDGG